MKKFYIFLGLIVYSFAQLYSQCTPAFTYQPDASNFVIFTNQTPQDTAFTYQWDFGDGSAIDTNYNAAHQYSSSGSFVVTLSVDSATISCGVTVDTIYVNFCNSNFTAQVTNNDVQFQNLSAASSSSSYNWDFDDGNFSSQKNPNHTYLISGKYDVKLDLYDTLNNCFSTFTDSIHISAPSCQAGFSYNTNKDTLLIQNQAINYQLLSYDFGDGDTSAIENPLHIYAQSGTYQVCQTVTNSANNCTDTFCDSVNITIPPPCKAGFTYTVNEDSIFIQNTASNYQSLSYDFGDGNTSTVENPIHIYAQSGTYQICQTIENTLNNCIDVFCDSISIIVPPPCQAGFTYSFQGDSTYFQNTAVNYNSLIYYFGDGESSTLENPVHRYANSGEYFVRQVVFNTPTCITSYRDTIQVTISTSCVAMFEVAIDTAKPSFLYLINNSSNDNTNQYLWDFGDGNSSTQKNPIHQYAENKPYPICLTVSDTVLNCISTYCDTVGLDSNGNILKSQGFTLKVLDGSAIGLNENNNPLEKVVLFPNPAVESFSVEWPKSIDKVQYRLFDLQGKVVLAGELQRGSRTSISLSPLKSGIYWVQIESKQNRVIRKIIKQ